MVKKKKNSIRIPNINQTISWVVTCNTLSFVFNILYNFLHIISIFLSSIIIIFDRASVGIRHAHCVHVFRFSTSSFSIKFIWTILKNFNFMDFYNIILLLLEFFYIPGINERGSVTVVGTINNNNIFLFCVCPCNSKCQFICFTP